MEHLLPTARPESHCVSNCLNVRFLGRSSESTFARIYYFVIGVRLDLSKAI